MGTASTKDKYKKSQCNNREQNSSAGLPPLKCTACLDDLCPRSLDSSLAVWRIVDFNNTPPPASPRFNLSTALASCTIDVFVSHTWYDQVFINGVKLISENRRRARNLPTPDESVAKKEIETTFYDLKCSGLLKGVRQLALRDISSLEGSDTFPADIKKWRIWMDLVCIDQYDETHKAHVTGLLEVYMREAKSMVVLLSPAYFTRLWCVFEYCCFLAFGDMSRIAVYAWGFCDQLTVAGSERSAAPEAVRALSTSLPDSLRKFSVHSAECSFACDKVCVCQGVCVCVTVCNYVCKTLCVQLCV